MSKILRSFTDVFFICKNARIQYNMNEERVIEIIERCVPAIVRRVLHELLNETPNAAQPHADALVLAETRTRDNTLALAETRTIALIRDSMREIIPVVSQQVSMTVYKAINTNINETIVPAIDLMNSRINYLSTDGDEMIDGFRRAAISAETAPLAIGNGSCVVITPHVRYAFDENH